VACAVRVLHLCGAALENSERVAHGSGMQAQSPKLDAVISNFELLLRSNMNAFGLSEDAKHLIKNLLDNRGDWIKYASQSDFDQQQPPDYNRVSSDTVYFGPDGEALTAEEASFLEQELGALQSSSSGEEDAAFAAIGNSEDDGVDAAYEEFLKMTAEKKRQQYMK